MQGGFMYGTKVSVRLSILFFLCIPVLSSSPSAQTHPITIHANQRVASLQMTPSEYREWIVDDGFEVEGKLEALVQDILPLSGLAPFDVFRGVTFYDDSTDEFEATTRVRYDQARITSELGERIPSSLSSQKDFRLLIVVLCDAPLTPAEWKDHDMESESFGKPASDGTFLYNFWEATGGRGTMETGTLNNAVKGTSIFAWAKPRKPGLLTPFSQDMLYSLTGRRIVPRAKALLP